MRPKMIVSGKVMDLVFLVLLCVATYILMRMDWTPTIRKIAAFDAIEEAIGRAVELGRPVHLTPGTGSLTNIESGPGLLAGLAVVEFAAKKCIELEQPFMISIGSSDAIALTEQLIKQAYQVVGKGDEFNPDVIRYYPGRDTIGNSLAFTNSVQGILSRHKPATNIMVGPFYGEQIALGEVAARGGAIQICGTQSLTQTSVMAAISDYILIGEDIFAAGAYVSQDPVQIKALVGGDIGKLIAIVLIIIGVIAEILGFSIKGVFA